MITTHVLDTRTVDPRAASRSVRSARRQRVAARRCRHHRRRRAAAHAHAGGTGRARHVSPSIRDCELQRVLSVVDICFAIVDGDQHYHVPLLLSPLDIRPTAAADGHGAAANVPPAKTIGASSRMLNGPSDERLRALSTTYSVSLKMKYIEQSGRSPTSTGCRGR